MNRRSHLIGVGFVVASLMAVAYPSSSAAEPSDSPWSSDSPATPGSNPDRGSPPPAPYPQQPAPGYQQPMPGYAPPGYAAPAGYPQPVPMYAPPPVYAGPLAPWYNSFYMHVGGTLGLHGWGGMTLSQSSVEASGDLAGKLRGGALLAGYAPVSPIFHLGFYASYGSGDMEQKPVKYKGMTVVPDTIKSFDHLSAGPSFKLGGRVNERIWMGLVTDVGFYMIDTSGSDAWYGVEISPRLHLDVLGTTFVSLGPTIVPYATGNFAHQKGVDGRAWLIYLTLCLGVTFGS